MPEVVENVEPFSVQRQDAPLESLKNRISLTDMGTRLARDAFQLRTQKSVSQAPGPNSAFDELLSFVFKYFSDLPDETLSAAAESVVAIMHDATLTDEMKKAEIETLLDEKLSNSTFNEIHTISARVQSRPSGDIGQKDDVVDLLDDLSEDDSHDSHDSGSGEAQEMRNAFVAINDPIRLRNRMLLRPQDIDGHWLQNQLKAIDSPISVDEVLEVLSSGADIELALISKLGVDNAGLAQLIGKNADVVLWYTRLHRAETGPEREMLINEIQERGLSVEAIAEREIIDKMDLDTPQIVDLNVVGRPMMISAAPNLKLPEGSTRFTTESYEQYNVPAVAVAKPDWPLKPVAELPVWARPAFAKIDNLNLVQSRVCDYALQGNGNLLLCAPTGAGKTNVALLALTRCLHQGFKAVYIAPLKALVQEQVRTLQERLPDHVVAELSGDQSLSREQLINADVLIATPEKWDIVSRKPVNTNLLRSVGLAIIDEIHLLHDGRRGSVLENIVARHSQDVFTPRLVGLSATLPNYTDIAEFLNVPPAGLFFFDSRFRPVPLEQNYVGVTAKSPLKVMKALNEACVEKVVESLNAGRQILVFVHSRRDTQATAKLLVEHETTDMILNKDEVAVHHAGLNREERAAAEYGFLNRKFKVLVCTATLAWGINLPAAVVIIKGTQYYDPSEEGWRQLQPQDVIQMLGRAGRPGFDVSGLGVILTEHKHLSYFASVATMRLPIQSHLVNRILDSLNAEVSFGLVRSLDEAIGWLKRTFWFVRSTKEPHMYGMSESSPRDIAHSALCELAKLDAAIYEYPNVRSTCQGQVASNFYVSPISVNMYTRQLKPWLTEIDLLRVFSFSSEFASIPVRRGEEAEIARLSTLVPLPVRDESSSRLAKVCVLTQAYICRLQLEGLALSADMVYIAQSASRLFRAIFQLCVAQRWSRLAQISLRLYIAVDRRQWYAGQSAFRQFSNCPSELVSRAEASQLPWKRYFDLDASDIGEALRLRDPQIADLAANFLSWFPRFKLSAKAVPLTPTVLQVNVGISPEFEFKKGLHSTFELFYLAIEDQHGTILEWKALHLNELLQSTSRRLVLLMPSESHAPYLFARLLSDKWLHSESSIPVSLRLVLPPRKFPAPLSFDSVSEEPEGIASLSALEDLSPLQRALIPLLHGSDASTYVGLPAGCDKLRCQMMVILRAREKGEKVLFITPKNSDWASNLATSLSQRFSVSTKLQDPKDVCILTSLELVRLTHAESRLRKNLGHFSVILCDDLHRLGGDDKNRAGAGWQYEVAITRLRRKLPGARIVGFGLTIATARAMGQWIGAQKGDVANIALSGGLEGPTIEARHWEGSILLALRDLRHEFELGLSSLFILNSAKQCTELAGELTLMGQQDVCVFTSVIPEQEHKKSLASHSIIVTTLAAVLEVETLQAEKVVLFGTQWSDNSGAIADVPIADVLELLSRAKSEVIVYTDRQQYYANFVTEPLPLESNLASNLIDAFVPEIAEGRVSSPQDAVDWLVSTYLYRRLRQNPSYYGSIELEEWISDTVEDSFDRLAQLGAVEVREEDLKVSPLTPAHIATYHGVPIEALMDTTHHLVMYNWSTHANDNMYNVLLLDARADLAVSRGDLALFFSTVDTRQSLVQSVPVGASPLLQIPYIDDSAALRCQDAGIASVQEFVAIEDDELRSSILGFDNDDPRMLEVAHFVNHYPIVDITDVRVVDGVALVLIERDIEEEDEVIVVAPNLPAELIEREKWYVAVGDANLRTIFGSKKVRIAATEMRVEVPLSDMSENMTAWLICDSYIDADKESEVK